MSLRQIRKLRKELEKDSSEPESPPKVTITSRPPRFSFNMLNDDDSDETSSSESESSDVSNPSSDDIVSEDSVDSQPSEDSDWEKLLEGECEFAEEKGTLAGNTFDDKRHFLSSSIQDFRCKEIGGAPGNARFKKSLLKSNNRYWLCPGVSTRELMSLRALCLRQLRIDVDSTHERETFLLYLNDSYREVDEICHVAVNSQDFELFRRLLESHPFHLGILTRASSINTISNNHEEAFKHLYLGVRMIQTVLPSKFSLDHLNSSGLPNVWMPSKLEDNIVIYRLLLLYMISLERQGQWSVALAICKLLIAMDFPEDTCHGILHVDLYILNHEKDPNSIPRFIFNYCKQIEYTLPPLHLFLPNFAFSLPLQLFLHNTIDEEVPILEQERLLEIKKLLKKTLLLVEDATGVSFSPKTEFEEYLELLKDLGVYAPYLFLLRSLLTFPQFIVRMAEKHTSNLELRSIASQDFFSVWNDYEDSDFDSQLVRCYITKSGDLWTGKNGSFLCNTALLLVELLNDPDCKSALESFQALWSAYMDEVDLPEYLFQVSATEFDLSTYSLPMQLEIA
ncbi:conserved hypothetical protein [Theileria equi strain WA]|uniref:Transcription factor 25 n=1 Tax=Theileria equi strain WA TaxID=1537102 RepID=L1LGA2_THEEQ|nr:conserved hypothetical protein [Theileria equi strain WA]EKX74183.1 conserved hypothetical protein [Theileria equi strain WA]|eukprot:XP_004833635.1 conserved hypothetical protein [Theileria equi strain WA]